MSALHAQRVTSAEHAAKHSQQINTRRHALHRGLSHPLYMMYLLFRGRRNFYCLSSSLPLLLGLGRLVLSAFLRSMAALCLALLQEVPNVCKTDPCRCCNPCKWMSDRVRKQVSE
eukprot:GHVU01030104.1.p4 GENE.GHVU01030104.1~~GHVU01030104.1.p4  ORF type:complete len:115 (+),score=3.51 GHVU01030104.1:640-984(+)